MSQCGGRFPDSGFILVRVLEGCPDDERFPALVDAFAKDGQHALRLPIAVETAESEDGKRREHEPPFDSRTEFAMHFSLIEFDGKTRLRAQFWYPNSES